MTGAERAATRLAAELDLHTGLPCQLDPGRWFSELGRDRAEAASACVGRCPAVVLVACGEYADAADERHGVWGGRDRTPGRRRGEVAS